MNISASLQNVVAKTSLQLHKYSPQILTVAGIAGLVGAGVLAAKQTLKLESTLEVANDRLEEAKQGDNDITPTAVRKAYVTNVFDLAKLYWAPVTLATGSVVLILVGHNILHKRNVALIGAYKGLEQVFSEYRKRVIEEHGEEADEKYYFGVRDVTETDPETGKKVKSRTINPGEYILAFDESNENWSGHMEDNLFFLKRHENIFNDRLNGSHKGHVYLNEVLDALGMDRTRAGAVTGWVRNSPNGDNYVSFGIKENLIEKNRILLNFNVDGPIIDFFN